MWKTSLITITYKYHATDDVKSARGNDSTALTRFGFGVYFTIVIVLTPDRISEGQLPFQSSSPLPSPSTIRTSSSRRTWRLLASEAGEVQLILHCLYSSYEAAGIIT